MRPLPDGWGLFLSIFCPRMRIERLRRASHRPHEALWNRSQSFIAGEAEAANEAEKEPGTHFISEKDGGGSWRKAPLQAGQLPATAAAWCNSEASKTLERGGTLIGHQVSKITVPGLPEIPDLLFIFPIEGIQPR